MTNLAAAFIIFTAMFILFLKQHTDIKIINEINPDKTETIFKKMPAGITLKYF